MTAAVPMIRKHGLPARLMAFFASNPNEELTIRQIAAKFHKSEGYVRNALVGLVGEGVVESVRVIRLPNLRKKSNVTF